MTPIADLPARPTLTSTVPLQQDAALRALLVDQVTTQNATVRRPPRRALAVLSAAAAVAIATTVMLLNDPTAPPAYAAWTAVPGTAPGVKVPSDTMERWASACNDLGVGGVSVQGVPSNPEGAATRDVLIDRRGSYTYCLDVSPGTATRADPLMSISGLIAEAGREKGLTETWSTVSDQPYTRPTGRDVLVLGGDTRTPPPTNEGPDGIALHTYQLYGMAGSDVTGIDFVLTNGLHVTATVHNGIWGAWWPTDRGDPTGVRLQVISGDETRMVDPTTVQLPG